jgi:hypothetical protein
MNLSDMLSEGLEKTYPLDDTINHLERWSIWESSTVVTFVENRSKINCNIDTITKPEFDSIIQSANTCGYFPSGYLIIHNKEKNEYNYEDIIALIDNADEFVLFLEAKYDIQLDNHDLPSLMYHISTTPHKDKILTNGLVPRTSKTEKLGSHPERIYLCSGMEHISALINHRKFIKMGEKAIVFEVNIKNLLLKHKNMSFYNDPNYNAKGCYTVNNIPPAFLRICFEQK